MRVGTLRGRLHTLGFPSAHTVYLAQNAHRVGGRGGGGQLELLSAHGPVQSLVRLVLVRALRGESHSREGERERVRE